jgi:asparagine synthase (glutamine-hydrolysing)
MSGIVGWWGAPVGDPHAAIERMAARLQWHGARAQRTIEGADFALSVLGAEATLVAHDEPTVKLVMHGHPYWRGASPASDHAAVGAAFARAYRAEGVRALERLGGDFALALVDVERREIVLAVDRMGVRNLSWQRNPDGLAFAANLDALGEHPSVEHRVAPQALYDYLYFHVVPGPATIFERSQRLLPGHRLAARGDTVDVAPYWSMSFDVSSTASEANRVRAFRAALDIAVGAYASGRCGTFLSGGTDSSTVTGLLSKQSSRAVPSFSIGFEAQGYDEMAYARIAAKRFATDHHEYYVTPDDVERALGWLADAFDQPFGNSSAVPGYYCAELARRSGVDRMLAGDGGDELFGGNARYARQHQFELYERLPSTLRSYLLEPLLGTSLAARVPLVRKAKSYVAQATMPMPARYESYNLLERLGPENVLEPDFLASVDRRAPLTQLEAWWGRASAHSLVDRMLALDLKFTLADNDLPKVTRMCDYAGVDVAFPMLHDDVVAVSATLPPRDKLRGTKLRPFFKDALRDLLPPQIIAKQKHGFGLPAGPWIASHPRLNAMMRDAMASLARRGIVRKALLDDVVERRLAEHPGYYGTLLWILLTLELWLARRER